MSIKKEYHMISPHGLVRADEHIEALISLEEKEYEGTTSSYKNMIE